MNDNEQFSDLPVNLFNGNLNLIDLSLKNNKLFQLDASTLPLERLRKLSLADNPFACNCSMIWLWQLIKSSSVVSTNEMNSSNSMTADTGDDDDAMTNNNTNSLLILDKENIGCDIAVDGADNDMKVIRKRLDEMSEADIKCPTQIVTIVSVILTVTFIAIVCVSILIFIKCSRSAQLKRRQQKYLSSERQNIGELIIPQKIDKFELERYLAEQQLQHQQKQQQIQQQYQMNNHHTIQPIHTNQNQYFQHQNSLIKPNEYRSLKKWENGGSGGVGGVAIGGGMMQHYPTLNSGSPHHHHHSSAGLKTSTASTLSSSSPLKKLHHKNNVNNILSSYNHNKSASTLSQEDEDGMEEPQERIYATHPDDEESAVEEDHYEHFDDNYLNSLNRKINIQSTLPLTKPPSSANTVYNTNGNSKKSLHNNVKPHIVYVWLKRYLANNKRFDFM